MIKNETKTYNSLNDAEKDFVKKHPLVSLYFKEAARKALIESQIRFSNDGLTDGNGDAFRHAYWNALMVQAGGFDLAKEYADAHENFPENVPSVMNMDLHNNAVGREIGQRQLIAKLPNGKSFEIKVTDGYLIQWVLQALQNGELQTSPKE